MRGPRGVECSMMSKDPSDDRLSDELADKSHMHLQCVGSFRAHAQDGELYTIEIWTHFGDVHDRERHRVAQVCWCSRRRTVTESIG